MANLTLEPTWEADIYRIETTDPVIGGEDGISNRHAKQLGNRTEFLKLQLEDLEPVIDDLEASSNQFNRMKGVGSLVKQGVVTAPLTNNVFQFVSTAKLSPSPIQNRVTITATTSSPVILSFSNGYDANGPIVYYGRVTATQEVLTGSNLTAFLFAELNPTTGEVTFGLDISNTVIYSTYVDPSTTGAPFWNNQGYWYSLKDEKLYAWNGTAWVASLRIILGIVAWGGANGSFTPYGRVGVSLKDLTGRSVIPAGTVQSFAGATAPDGYLICDGSALSRTIYSELFAVIGTTYGAGNGTTTFNLPDLRGEFIRGLDGGRGVDSGRALGSAQEGTGITSNPNSIGSNMFQNIDGNYGSATTFSQSTSTSEPDTYNRMRPRNVALNFIIKF